MYRILAANAAAGDRRNPLVHPKYEKPRLLATTPRVSDDNPYSEAHFKALKYQPGFPGRFCGHHHALSHGRVFFPWYNNHHHHGALARLTPADVHFGRTTAVIQKRQRVLDDAFRAHPERFVHGRPTHPDPPPQNPGSIRPWRNGPCELRSNIKSGVSQTR
ncbi:MAG: hypothetical protein Q9Q13_00545 [Acidobacteriota bacterium]|nr:hypothetical protein [Acidobacteriota bacterium]